MSKIRQTFLLSIFQALSEHIPTMPLVWPHSEGSAIQIVPARPQLRKHVRQRSAAPLNILVCAHISQINKQRCVVIFRPAGQAALAAFRPVLAPKSSTVHGVCEMSSPSLPSGNCSLIETQVKRRKKGLLFLFVLRESKQSQSTQQEIWGIKFSKFRVAAISPDREPETLEAEWASQKV